MFGEPGVVGLVGADDAGDGVERGAVGEQLLFDRGQLAAVAAQEGRTTIGMAGPVAVGEPDQVAGCGVDAGVLEVHDPHGAGVVDEPVARLVVEVARHPSRDRKVGDRADVPADQALLGGGEEPGCVSEPVVEAAGEVLGVVE